MWVFSGYCGYFLGNFQANVLIFIKIKYPFKYINKIKC